MQFYCYLEFSLFLFRLQYSQVFKSIYIKWQVLVADVAKIQRINFVIYTDDLKSQARSISEEVKRAYFLYFKCQIGDQDKTWAPHVCCVSCHINLVQWMHRKKKSMPFAVPMVWREPTDHVRDCYFCITKTEGFSKKQRDKIQYPNLPSAIRPVPHSEELPVPIAPLNLDNIVLGDSSSSTESDLQLPKHTTDDPTFLPSTSSEPHLITQNKLNDLVRDLGLSKQKSELLGSRLQEWNLLDKNATVSFYRKRNITFSSCYKIAVFLL